MPQLKTGTTAQWKALGALLSGVLGRLRSIENLANQIVPRESVGRIGLAIRHIERFQEFACEQMALRGGPDDAGVFYATMTQQELDDYLAIDEIGTLLEEGEDEDSVGAL